MSRLNSISAAATPPENWHDQTKANSNAVGNCSKRWDWIMITRRDKLTIVQEAGFHFTKGCRCLPENPRYAFSIRTAALGDSNGTPHA